MVLRPRNGLSLCAGAGGLDMGLMLAEPGFHTRCFVEWEDYPRKAIIAAQRAGYFAPAPIWDDVTTFDGRPLRGAIDTILAGYPCQPFSMAGQRKGADDERHLWPDVARIIREIEPRWVSLENVAGHLSLGLETVLRDLWGMGWTPAAGLFSAGETGAPHERQRVFVVAYRDGNDRRADGRQPHAGADGRHEPSGRGGKVADAYANADAGRLDSRTTFCAPGGSGGDSEERQWIRAWSGRGCDELADASGAGQEGREQRGPFGQRDGSAASGPTAELRRALLFPPGPGDRDAWADTLAAAPYLAPATSLADCLSWARDMAAALEISGQEAAKPALRRMADGLALRSRALRLLGNGVHPLAAGYAWRSLAAAHGLGPVDLEADHKSRAAAAIEPVEMSA